LVQETSLGFTMPLSTNACSPLFGNWKQCLCGTTSKWCSHGHN